MAVVAHRAHHGAADARRPVHVDPHLDQLRDDLLNLLFGRPLLHHDDHTALHFLSRPQPMARPALPICGSRPRRRAVPGACRRLALQPPRLVDDSLEEARHRLGARAVPGWPRRARGRSPAPAPRVPADRSAAQRLLELADLQRAGARSLSSVTSWSSSSSMRARPSMTSVDASRWRLSRPVQPPDECFDRGTQRRRVAASAITWTSALPTTAASA